MTGRIGTWHRRYRLCGSADHLRADDLANGPVLAEFEAALQLVFGSENAVILIREVNASVTINLANLSGRAPAETWGRAMVSAVVRAIHDETRSGNVVRYPSEAAHLAAFAGAVAAGQPADSWVFERFAIHRRTTPVETLNAVLMSHPEVAAEIVRRLFESGDLIAVLSKLDREALSCMWIRGVQRGEVQSDESIRPLFAAAIAILEALSGTLIDRNRADRAWADLRLSSFPTADWRDRSQLTDAAIDLVRFLARKLAIAWAQNPPDLGQALVSLDWLDLPRLREQLCEAGDEEQPRSHLARPRRGATVRQRAWLEALFAAITRVGPHLDRGDFQSHGNALIVFAAITADHPDWSADPALPGFIETALVAASQIASSGWEHRPVFLQLGDRAIAVVQALVGTTPPCTKTPPVSDSKQTRVRIASAGLFLLYRSVIDLRLAALTTQSHYPPGPTNTAIQRFLFTLATRLAGLPTGEPPGPDLLLFAGIEPQDYGTKLWSEWEDDVAAIARYQQGLARMLLGHRLFDDPTRLRLAVVPNPAGDFLAIAGDETLRLWPFCTPVKSPVEAGLQVIRWAADWRELTGSQPTLIRPSLVPTPLELAAETADDIPAELQTVLGMANCQNGNSHRDATLAAVANATIRAWARWLKYIGHSSTLYLIRELIRRPGYLKREGKSLVVELEPRPLDLALSHSGYLDPVELPAGTLFRSIRFRIGGPG